MVRFRRISRLFISILIERPAVLLEGTVRIEKVVLLECLRIMVRNGSVLDTVVHFQSPQDRLIPDERAEIDLKPVIISSIVTFLFCLVTSYWLYVYGFSIDLYTLLMLFATFCLLSTNTFIGIKAYSQLRILNEAQYAEFLHKASMIATHEKIPAKWAAASPIWTRPIHRLSTAIESDETV